jgi:hypothetical protein
MDRVQHQLRTSAATLLLALSPLLAACHGTGEAGAAERGSPAHVDSVVPREVELARFRDGLTKPDSLSGGEASREALIRSFVRALETRDTAALRQLSLTRAEFAWLYYPTNPQAAPPYDLSPALLWFLLEGRSRQGFYHLLEERAGAPLGYLDHRCLGEVSLEGDNRVVGPCLVRRLQAPGDTVEEKLFGPVVERGGRFKFVSYANPL